jgi:hypothetical protein
MRVVVLDVLGGHDFEVAPSEDEHPVQALAPDGVDESLREGVGPRRPDGRLDHRDALRGEDGVEGRSELGVSVSNEELDCRCLLDECHAEVSGPLGHLVGEIDGDAGDPDSTLKKSQAIGPFA